MGVGTQGVGNLGGMGNLGGTGSRGRPGIPTIKRWPKVFCPSLPLGAPGTPSCTALPVLAPTSTQPHLLQNRIFQTPAQSY